MNSSDHRTMHSSSPSSDQSMNQVDSDVRMSGNETSNQSVYQTNNQLINQFKKTNELLRYDFIIPLLLVYFTDHDVLTRLLITCKSIKRFMFHYRIEQQLHINQASSVAKSYWPAMITNVHNVVPHDMEQLSSFPSLTSVALYDCDQEFDMCLIPASVTHMARFVDGAICSDSFPESLISLDLTVHDDGDDLKPNTLPRNLKSLTLRGDDFEIPVGFLPNTLIELNIDGYLANDGDLSIFPGSLTSLVVRAELESTLILPDSLLYLTIQGLWSSDSFPEGLPPNLVSFELTVDDFDLDNGQDDFPEIKEIEFPATLTRLRLHQQAAPGVIPNTVTDLMYHVKLHEEDDWALQSGVIPNSVTHLDLLISDCKTYGTSQGMLPNSITHLAISIPSDNDDVISIGFIPCSVTHLTWGTDNDWDHGMPITSMCIPVSVASCACGHMCQCPRIQMAYSSSIPASVTHLTFGDMFNQVLKQGDVPRSVTNIVFGNSFNQKLVAGAISDSVTHLTFGDLFNQLLTSDSIPDSVQYLQFGKKFNQSVPAHVLPSSLKRLTFARQHSPPIDVDHVNADVAYLTNY